MSFMSVQIVCPLCHNYQVCNNICACIKYMPVYICEGQQYTVFHSQTNKNLSDIHKAMHKGSRGYTHHKGVWGTHTTKTDTMGSRGTHATKGSGVHTPQRGLGYTHHGVQGYTHHKGIWGTDTMGSRGYTHHKGVWGTHTIGSRGTLASRQLNCFINALHTLQQWNQPAQRQWDETFGVQS